MRDVNLAEELVLKDKDTTLSAGSGRASRLKKGFLWFWLKKRFSSISCL